MIVKRYSEDPNKYWPLIEKFRLQTFDEGNDSLTRKKYNPDNEDIEIDYQKYQPIGKDYFDSPVVNKKEFFSKDDMKKISYSKMETNNPVTQQSFVSKFLQSVRQKMYGKRKF